MKSVISNAAKYRSMKILQCSTKQVKKNFERNFVNVMQDAVQLYVFSVYVCVFKYVIKHSMTNTFVKFTLI